MRGPWVGIGLKGRIWLRVGSGLSIRIGGRDGHRKHRVEFMDRASVAVTDMVTVTVTVMVGLGVGLDCA